jgi:AmmeMemoRadiSam system protein A
VIRAVLGTMAILCAVGSGAAVNPTDSAQAELRTPQVRSRVLALARESLEAEVTGPSPVLTMELPEVLTTRRAGAFVTVTAGSPPRLRGCWGTVWPTKESLAEEIRAAARGAAACDTRFEPIQPEELPRLRYTVSIVLDPEPVRDLSEIRPARDGVLVRKGSKQGVALPHEGKTISYLIEIARSKAGIAKDEDYEILKFETVRIGEALGGSANGGKAP